jgi:predicted alpha/beta-fold hydrolase
LTWAYRAPWWLPGGDAQTIYAAKFAQRYEGATPHWARERWFTPDADFVDVDWLLSTHTTENSPLLVLFHGLEGSSQSHYVEAFAEVAATRGWRMAVPHFRGCSGEINWRPRAYHSGDFEEIGWMLQQFRQQHPAGPVHAVGISLGGNALMRWAGEMGHEASQHVRSIASVCSPIDLTASGHAIDRGFNKVVYARMFLASMKPRALDKLQQFPGLFSKEALLAADTLYAFDDVFTAPLHGFENTDDYWHRASAKPGLSSIRVPALVLNALNDPFVPADSLPTPSSVGDWVQLWQPRDGGHVGFVAGSFPGHVRAMPQAVVNWLETGSSNH